jgi:hypothetical protein
MDLAATKPSLWVIGSENPRIRDFFGAMDKTQAAAAE